MTKAINIPMDQICSREEWESLTVEHRREVLLAAAIIGIGKAKEIADKYLER